jgi:hypothetical protein
MALMDSCEKCASVVCADTLIEHNNKMVCSSCLLCDLEQLESDLDKLKALGVHKRRCWDCGRSDWFLDSITPYVLCHHCGSQDTRKLKG